MRRIVVLKTGKDPPSEHQLPSCGAPRPNLPKCLDPKLSCGQKVPGEFKIIVLGRELNIRTVLSSKRESGFPWWIKALRIPLGGRWPIWVEHVSRASTAIFVRYPLFTGTGMPAIFSLTDPSVDRVVK